MGQIAFKFVKWDVPELATLERLQGLQVTRMPQ